MINLYYIDDNKRKVEFELNDWESVLVLAQRLSNAPVNIEYLYYEDGIFNLHTFEKC